MRELVDALAARVSEACHVETGAEVIAVEHSASGSPRPVYRLRLRDSRAIPADAIIITLPAYGAAELVESLDPPLATTLNGIDYASSAIVVSGHRLANIADPLNAFGLVVPHIERRRILAVSFSSRKFPNRAPEGRVLLRTFVGGAMQPELFDLDDASLRRLVLDELHDTLGVTGTPDFVEIYRFPRSMPQYFVGHLERVAEIDRLAVAHRGLALAGNAYHGVGVPDAIHSGERAAEIILDEIVIDACE
jgi:oxygen-dependent protoporphyrinogen oxidase